MALFVQALEHGAAPVHIILALAQVEVNDIDRYHLLGVGVGLARVHAFVQYLGRVVGHAVEMVDLVGVLDLADDEFLFGVLGQDVHPVELVVRGLAVVLTLQDFLDLGVIKEQLAQKALHYHEVSFVAEEFFDGPVETDRFFAHGGPGFCPGWLVMPNTKLLLFCIALLFMKEPAQGDEHTSQGW